MGVGLAGGDDAVVQLDVVEDAGRGERDADRLKRVRIDEGHAHGVAVKAEGAAGTKHHTDFSGKAEIGVEAGESRCVWARLRVEGRGGAGEGEVEDGRVSKESKLSHMQKGIKRTLLVNTETHDIEPDVA